MRDIERRKAAFFAECASLPPDLTPGQQLLLKEQAEALFAPKPDMKSLLHYTRTWIPPLVRGEVVKPDLQPIWRVRDGELAASIAIAKPGHDFVGDLWRLLHERPFPFKQCAFCSNIFASQSTKKRYCSANCTYRGVEEARKDKQRPKAKARMRRLRERRAQEEVFGDVDALKTRALERARRHQPRKFHA